MTTSSADDLDRLRRAIAVADQILGLVATEAPVGVESRDQNDQFLVLAFGRAFRCFRSIRDLAAVHAEADDVFVLTRALMVVALRSLWVATPDDREERTRRDRMLQLASFVQLRKRARSMEALDMDPGVPSEDLEREIEPLAEAGVEPLPSDEVMAAELGWEELYANVYRSASDVAHYSLVTALAGFDVSGIDDDVTSFDGLRIRFADGDPGEAERALLLATTVYVSFLERCEFVVHHGVFEAARSILVEHAESRSSE